MARRSTDGETGFGTRRDDDVVEVLLFWCAGGSDAPTRNVIGVRRVAKGGALSLGERGDLLVPREALGADRIEIIHYDDDDPVAVVPYGAELRVDGELRNERTFVLPPSQRSPGGAETTRVEIVLGAFIVELTREPAGARPVAPPLESLRRSGAGYFAGSAAFHAAIFATVALFAPALGAAEEDPLDPDRLALIQHLLNASAAREMERTPAEEAGSSGASAPSGPKAAGPEGVAGNPRSTPSAAREAHHSTLSPDQDAAAARGRDLAEASRFGAVDLLLGIADGASLAGMPAAWDRPATGEDNAEAMGHLFGSTIGDALGTGIGLHGPGEGGGGTANVLGLGGFGLGGRGGCDDMPCSGDGGGIGHGRGQLGRGHVPSFKGPRYPKDVITNGHLPPEVIQRIVRQNDGRFRACYEQGLRANPSLTGRVTVKFVVDRAGAVALASDGGSDLPDEGVRRCVVSAFAALSFPAPASGMLTVSYPIVFNPE
jgi:hypothetical protein